MSLNLCGQIAVVVGGSSGNQHDVAKTSLLHHAAHITIESSSKEKVDSALLFLGADAANALVVPLTGSMGRPRR